MPKEVVVQVTQLPEPIDVIANNSPVKVTHESSDDESSSSADSFCDSDASR